MTDELLGSNPTAVERAVAQETEMKVVKISSESSVSASVSRIWFEERI